MLGASAGLAAMKTSRPSEGYWTTRLAPYVSVGVFVALCVSLSRAVPPLWCMVLGGGSGGLVFLFHALEWRTGRAGFKLAAIASFLLPMFVAVTLSRGSGALLPLQYVGVYAVAYFFYEINIRDSAEDHL